MVEATKDNHDASLIDPAGVPARYQENHDHILILSLSPQTTSHIERTLTLIDIINRQ
jgi:hypothetical protein